MSLHSYSRIGITLSPINKSGKEHKTRSECLDLLYIVYSFFTSIFCFGIRNRQQNSCKKCRKSLL